VFLNKHTVDLILPVIVIKTKAYQ